MKKQLIILLPLLLLLTGCGGTRQEPLSCTPPESRRLVVYTSHKEEVYTPIIREFEERTGIWVEVVTGGTNELLQRIDAEKDAPAADVMFGGGVESLESYRHLFQPVHCAELEQVSAGLRRESDSWVPFSALPLVLIYNVKLVDPARLTGWEDLTRPEFQGKIAFADPTKSASSFTAVVTVLQACGEDTLTRLAQSLGGSQLGSSGEVLTAVADGEALVGITLEETALQRIAAGDNLGLVYPGEGTSCVPDGTALVSGAPHRENGEKFLEFTLSREVQQLLGSRFYRRSVREDVTVPSSLPAAEDLALIAYDPRWASAHREEILSQWAAAVEGR